MNMAFPVSVLLCVLGYLLGSIPFGLLLTQAAGLGDIRAIGSGNIGATNVLRTGSKALAAGTLLLDGLKGVAAVLVARAFGGQPVALVAGFAAVVGHMFPVWLGFRGGKGAATGLGVLLAAAWPIGVTACAVWLAAFAIVRISSVGALAGFASAPLAALVIENPGAFKLALTVAVLVFIRHHANIRRLVAGQEPRVGRRKTGAA
ncbi:MAG TPA: glycerol-3-phosphate 1-O-acyltransferase PlsY [Rhodopila sp.]|uniref:glycerol-3-phosphate 1-O-acyltransferase PlsY n=1 Tax=Rhodopila sp. TaxID=2480087 RepID=UPI002B525F39|nr:glycerol-3-phosphate 1-O-acyltransferase PlsY [Rhodopila sp.]HVY17408.1 glycerol-3-phosphate 1-O-acyltransferase PlsY [Rhodopila sp.]